MHIFVSTLIDTAAVLVVTQQGFFNHMQHETLNVDSEDVTDPGILKAVEEAVMTWSTSVFICCWDIKWANVATAILKGAAQSKTLKSVHLATAKDFPPSQEVVDYVRRANPKLRLVVAAKGKSASHNITCHQHTATDAVCLM